MEAFVRTRVYFKRVKFWCAALVAACPSCGQTKEAPAFAKPPPVKIVEQSVNDRVLAPCCMFNSLTRFLHTVGC